MFLFEIEHGDDSASYHRKSDNNRIKRSLWNVVIPHSRDIMCEGEFGFSGKRDFDISARDPPRISQDSQKETRVS